MPPFPVEVRFPLQWGEMDALGHANNAAYFRWFEAARIELFRRAGLSFDASAEVVPVLVHTSCDFYRPAVWPADLVIGARVTRIGGSSIEHAYLACRADDEEGPLASGKGVVVLVRPGTSEKVPVPEPLRKALEAMS